MPMTGIRKIIRIDEEKCDGCGDCVPNCHEGAIRIVNGKARLVSENLCDGLGACLGQCPKGAITIEERPADAFDEKAVAKHLAVLGAGNPGAGVSHGHGLGLRVMPGPIPPRPAAQAQGHAHAHGHGAGSSGCPGAMMRELKATGVAAGPAAPASAVPPKASRLTHWPVQLALLPPAGRMWQDAHVLIAADCVAFAMPDFQDRLLAGKSLAVACPKLDDVEPYVEKLTQVFARNSVRSVTVAHMEVPCCMGIVHVVHTAMERSGRTDIPVEDITVALDGKII